MRSIHNRLAWSVASPNSPVHTVVLACLVAFLSYLAAELAGALVLRPEMVWPLWPGCALLVAVLLLLPRGIWPILIAAGLAGFALYDLQAGLTLRSIALLILADTVEILIASFGSSYFCKGLPRLDSVASLARYSFLAVILAPIAAAFISTSAFSGNYWIRWRIVFFTEALALLTLTPAILAWVRTRQAWVRKSRAFYFEAAALGAGLTLLGYVAFVAPVRSSAPVLLYSLLPFLLWSALRFGMTGISTSMIVVAFLSIWGAVHGRGPFTGAEPLNNVMSLQLFLLFAVAPFMVLAVLVEERKRTGHALRESEERFRLVANSAPVLIWMSGPDKLFTYFNQFWLEFTGQPIATQLGNGWAQGVHPEDLKTCMDTYAVAFDRHQKFQMQYRLCRHDGEYRWVFEVGVPRFNPDGSFAGYIGSCIDVTERKVAEDALASLTGRLIEAQEQERTRIARELHDDYNQRLAIVAIGLGELAENVGNSSVEAHQRLYELFDRVSELGADLHSLSHQLHPSTLESLGLVAGLKAFCEEFRNQQGIQVDFAHENVPPGIPDDATLCIFRIAQEALRNIKRHSGANRAEVRIEWSGERLHLSVSDRGRGLDPTNPSAKPGIGIRSMEERLRLLGGRLEIHSRPAEGTRVDAWLPFKVAAQFPGFRTSGFSPVEMEFPGL
jgi:PAS domain S-box-containing protein